MAVEPSDESPAGAPNGQDAYERDAREWLETVYQGDTVRQLSPRAIITGMLIGGVMSISNLYVGLKTGWGLGVTITACIIAFAVFRTLEAFFASVRRNPFTILENYTMSSAASAAGYMSSAGLVSAIPALYLATGRQLAWWEMMTWLGALSTLGVFMAVPLKRQLINIDKLPFPTGLATAETLKSMHTAGQAAMAKARALLYAAVFGAVIALWRDGLPVIAAWFQSSSESLSRQIERVAMPDVFPLLPRSSWASSLLDRTTIGFEGSMIMIGAGAIMGIRVGASLLLGAIVYFGIIGPRLIDAGITDPGYDKMGINAWTLWPATAMMVTSGLLSFVLRWRTVLRAFQGLATMLGGSAKDDPLADVEVPGSWFVAGTVASGAACVLLGHFVFDITWWMGILAVLLTFVLSIVAARATGETDITPIGAMGKIVQLVYGVIAPASMTTNLMTANITAGAAAHSADLLTDLKSGYLLGGNPRKQTISQLFGVLAGTLVCVPVYALVADPERLGSVQMPAPSAKVWQGMAEMMAKGLDALPRGALTAAIIGGAIGIVLILAEEFAPKRYRKWIPSPIGLGIAGVIPAFNSISMFIGALIAFIIAKRNPAVDRAYTIPVSSGLIAGESLMGVAVILAHEAPGILENFQQQP